MQLAHWHLVRTPVILSALAIDFFGAGPALRRAKYDHRPERTLLETIFARPGFDALNFPDDRIQCGGHQLVHLFRIPSFDEIGRVAIAAEHVFQLLMTDAGENSR